MDRPVPAAVTPNVRFPSTWGLGPKHLFLRPAGGGATASITTMIVAAVMAAEQWATRPAASPNNWSRPRPGLTPTVLAVVPAVVLVVVLAVVPGVVPAVATVAVVFSLLEERPRTTTAAKKKRLPRGCEGNIG